MYGVLIISHVYKSNLLSTLLFYKSKENLEKSTGKHVAVDFNVGYDVTDKLSNAKLSKQEWKIESLRSLHTAENGLKMKRVNYLRRILCFADRASLYNLVNKTTFVHNLFLVYIFINLYMFRATMSPSSGETTVFMRHLVLVILCGWLSGMQEHMFLHTRQSSTQNNKYQVSHKHSCFSWWWRHSRPKHVEIDKYIY